MPDRAVIDAQIERLTAEVAHHKAEIGRHRRKLRIAASGLDAMSAMRRACEESLTVSEPLGAEGKDLHGRTDSQPR